MPDRKTLTSAELAEIARWVRTTSALLPEAKRAMDRLLTEHSQLKAHSTALAQAIETYLTVGTSTRADMLTPLRNYRCYLPEALDA